MNKDKTTNFDDLKLDELVGGDNVIYMDAELPEEPKTEEEEWADCLRRMEKHTKKMWITVKYNNKLYTYDGYECSDEVFFEWICQIWPPSRKLEHKAHQYHDAEIRLRTMINIAGLYKACDMKGTSLNKW